MINREGIKKSITNQKQMSDSLLLNLLLAFSGGFQDAYSFVVRDKVFANAQTGNIVLMSTNLMQGNLVKGHKYILPIFSFMLGIFIADRVQYKYKNARFIHWRQGIVLGEITIMFLVGLLPQNFNMLANCLISLSCAMQLNSFKKVHTNPYASTMCIGNLKSGVSAFSAYLRTKDRKYLSAMFDYVTVITIFAIGAGIGANLSTVCHERTIWTSGALLIIGFLMMGLDKKNK